MQLNLERPDYDFFLRGADGSSAQVNDRTLTRSFIMSPTTLVEDWPVTDIAALQAGDLEAVLALDPELVLLGSGAAQAFAPQRAQYALLSRGIGVESMTNAAVARTFNVLASEGRRVVAGFIFPG